MGKLRSTNYSSVSKIANILRGEEHLHQEEILATIRLAHFFESAFTEEQVYRFSRSKMTYSVFLRNLEELEAAGKLYRVDKLLFCQGYEETHRKKQEWSRGLFRKHRKILWLLVRMPWVKFMALTGANAFESCCEQDDIDLFLITQADRLWLCYLLIVVITKLLGKRPLLCLNYAVDENHLYVPEENYYTAVQIIQMLPLVESPLSREMVRQNSWIFNFLPNANRELPTETHYLLKRKQSRSNRSTITFGWLKRLNRRIYRMYARRLAKKFPAQFGKGIMLSEGRAKLNRVDHQHIYGDIHRQTSKQVTV